MLIANKNGLSLIVAGIAVNVVAVAIPLELLTVTSGSAIRPMGHTAWMGLWSILAFGIMAVKSLMFMLDHRRWLWGICGLLLGITPFFASLAVFRIVIELKHFTMKP